jgi:uroporphyrinogen decarboxylase
MQQIIAGLAPGPAGERVPVILFTKGGGAWLEDMAETGCEALGIDWTLGLDEARRRVGHRVALQGNLDPSALYAAPQVIRAEVARVLEAFGAGSGHVFNLGHGIHPNVDPAHAAAMIDAVRELSPPYHAP